MPPVQNIAIGVFLFSLFRYLGKSLKLLTSGLIDLLKVPTLNSNGFLESKTKVFLLLINLFHFFGSIFLFFFFYFLMK